MEKETNLNSAIEKFKKRDFESALELFLKSIKEDPKDFRAYNYAGIIFGMANLPDDAQKYFDKAIELRPEFSDAYSNKGIVLSKLGRFEEALNFFKKAKSIAPENQSNYYNHAVALQECGEIDDALVEFEKTILINPENAAAHFHLALLYLMKDEYRKGWQEYEWGFKSGDLINRHLSKPKWDGTKFTDKRLYIYSDQGFGDTFQFLRFLPDVKMRGGEIVLEVEDSIKDLVRDFGFYDELVIGNKERRPAADYDIHIPLLSIPGLIDPELYILNRNYSYLTADKLLTEKWKKSLKSNGKLNVGFVWTGNPVPANNRKRHMRIDDFEPLFKLKDINWYSLQKEIPETEQKIIDENKYNFKDLGKEIGNFSDTAAIMEALDLVITIDTSVAHLAGAMGKKCWVMLTNVPDWRWGISGENCKWYSSLKLFRQNERGNWKSVIDEIESELLKLSR